MEQIALIMNNAPSRLAADMLFAAILKVMIRKPSLHKWVLTTQLTVYDASKYGESHGYLLSKIIQHFNGFHYTCPAEAY